MMVDEPTSGATGVNGAAVSLFDEHGRCVPSDGITAAVHRKIRRYFDCTQPEIDYADIHRRISTHLGGNGGLSAADFERRAEAILERLRADPRSGDILEAVRVPFFLPRGIEAGRDIGESLDQRFLPAVAAAYVEKFPGHDFINHHKSGLAGRLSIVPESRHDRLYGALAEDCVVGWYFVALSEYSVPAAIEQVAELPEDFLLAGGIDTCAAFIGSPGLLLRTEGYSPLLWLTALAAEKEGIGYHFEPYGYDLTFNRRSHLGAAAEYWANALTVIG